MELLQKDEDEYDEDDLKHMGKVISYVHRHSAQGPSKGDVETSKWRYSMMNWLAPQSDKDELKYIGKVISCVNLPPTLS